MFVFSDLAEALTVMRRLAVLQFSTERARPREGEEVTWIVERRRSSRVTISVFIAGTDDEDGTPPLWGRLWRSYRLSKALRAHGDTLASAELLPACSPGYVVRVRLIDDGPLLSVDFEGIDRRLTFQLGDPLTPVRAQALARAIDTARATLADRPTLAGISLHQLYHAPADVTNVEHEQGGAKVTAALEASAGSWVYVDRRGLLFGPSTEDVRRTLTVAAAH